MHSIAFSTDPSVQVSVAQQGTHGKKRKSADRYTSAYTPCGQLAGFLSMTEVVKRAARIEISAAHISGVSKTGKRAGFVRLGTA